MIRRLSSKEMKRVSPGVISMIPTGSTETPPPPPPPMAWPGLPGLSEGGAASWLPPPAPKPYFTRATGMIVFPSVWTGSP